MRTISFAGLAWDVKRADSAVGPGPNRFSDQAKDVWVDHEGLHLTISKREGRWYSTEVGTRESFGYGTYIFHARGRIDVLDPVVVLGLFTWDSPAPPHYRELDIEYSRWSNADEPLNGQFVVQPGKVSRYRLDLGRDTAATHVMRWSPGKVVFKAAFGHHLDVTADRLIRRWRHEGGDVPAPGNEGVRINLWLHRGAAPAIGKTTHVVVTDFIFRERRALIGETR